MGNISATNDNQGLKNPANKHAVPSKSDSNLSQHGGENSKNVGTKSDYSLPQHGGEQVGK